MYAVGVGVVGGKVREGEGRARLLSVTLAQYTLQRQSSQPHLVGRQLFSFFTARAAPHSSAVNANEDRATAAAVAHDHLCCDEHQLWFARHRVHGWIYVWQLLDEHTGLVRSKSSAHLLRSPDGQVVAELTHGRLDVHAHVARNQEHCRILCCDETWDNLFSC